MIRQKVIMMTITPVSSNMNNLTEESYECSVCVNYIKYFRKVKGF